jgi:hypothetical protein
MEDILLSKTISSGYAYIANDFDRETQQIMITVPCLESRLFYVKRL